MKIIKQFPYAAYLQLCIDLACERGTPEIIVTEFVQQHLGLLSPKLNISGQAVRNFTLSDSRMSFDCTVGGEPLHVSIHPAQVIAVNVRDAEGWCFFPNGGNLARFMCKTEAGKEHLRTTQHEIVDALEKLDQKEPPIKEISEKKEPPKTSNVVSLTDYRKK